LPLRFEAFRTRCGMKKLLTSSETTGILRRVLYWVWGLMAGRMALGLFSSRIQRQPKSPPRSLTETTLESDTSRYRSSHLEIIFDSMDRK